MRGFRYSLIFLALVLIVPWPLQAEVPIAYDVVNLGRAGPGGARRFAGGEGSVLVEGLDEAGTVVGGVLMGTRVQAAILYPTFQLLGALTPGFDTTAQDVDGGTVVGNGFDATGANHAWQWTVETGMVDITAPMLLATVGAVKGNLIIGRCTLTTGQAPCLWVSGVPHLLTTPSGGDGDGARLNPSGVVVGSYQTPAGPSHAYVSIGGVPQDIHPPTALNSRAVALTALNVVLGEATIIGQGIRLFQWTMSTGLTLYDAFPGFPSTTASDITEALTIGVGEGNGMFAQRVLRWPDPATPQDVSPLLTEPGWDLYNAVRLNDAGMMLVYGTKDNADYALLLTPVVPPPPSDPPEERRPKKTKHEKKDKPEHTRQAERGE
jgi:hypothetical protein